MNEVELFLKKHGACSEGYSWAVNSCKTMQEVWDTAKTEWLVWLAIQKGVAEEKILHRFACWSVRQIWHLLKDERSQKAIEVKERWIDGDATNEELDAARDAAMDAVMEEAWAAAWDAAWAAARAAAWAAEMDAARDAARDAVMAAAWDAAWAAERDAARDAVMAAAWDAAWAAERDAARDAVMAAARDAARDAQAKWIRDNITPSFEVNT